jgi:hypothetical protein
MRDTIHAAASHLESHSHDNCKVVKAFSPSSCSFSHSWGTQVGPFKKDMYIEFAEYWHVSNMKLYKQQGKKSCYNVSLLFIYENQ